MWKSRLSQGPSCIKRRLLHIWWAESLEVKVYIPVIPNRFSVPSWWGGRLMSSTLHSVLQGPLCPKAVHHCGGGGGSPHYCPQGALPVLGQEWEVRPASRF